MHTAKDTNAWPTQARPLFIAFEGLDGSGKSTLAQHIARASGARYMTTPSTEVREYRERLLDALGPCQEARQLFYLATVFAASATIRAALAAEQSIVIDRYFLSTQAYAEFRGSQLEIDATSTLLVPADLTIYVDAPLEVRRERVMKRGASEADLETLTAPADARLRELHLARRQLDVVGTLVLVNSDQHAIDVCVEQIRDAAWRVADPTHSLSLAPQPSARARPRR